MDDYLNLIQGDIPDPPDDAPTGVTDAELMDFYAHAADESLKDHVESWPWYRDNPEVRWIFFSYFNRADYAIRLLEDSAKALKRHVCAGRVEEAAATFLDFVIRRSVGAEIDQVIGLIECNQNSEGELPSDVNDEILQLLAGLDNPPPMGEVSE